MNVTWLEKDAVPAEIARRVQPADIVLDVGPGIRPQKHVFPLIHICVEPFAPYIERIREGVGDDPRFVFLNCTWQEGLKTLPDKSVDSVFALDVILLSLFLPWRTERPNRPLTMQRRYRNVMRSVPRYGGAFF